MIVAHVYPCPTDEDISPLARAEIIEIWRDDDLLIDDAEPCDHPEVPLTVARRDLVLARLGFARIGPWSEEDDGRAEAPVVAQELSQPLR